MQLEVVEKKEWFDSWILHLCTFLYFYKLNVKNHPDARSFKIVSQASWGFLMILFLYSYQFGHNLIYSDGTCHMKISIPSHNACLCLSCHRQVCLVILHIITSCMFTSMHMGVTTSVSHNAYSPANQSATQASIQAATMVHTVTVRIYSTQAPANLASYSASLAPQSRSW